MLRSEVRSIALLFFVAFVVLLPHNASGHTSHPASSVAHGDVRTLNRRSLEGTFKDAKGPGAVCRFGGNVQPIPCAAGLVCAPDSPSTLSSLEGDSIAGNPDFATEGVCVEVASASEGNPTDDSPSAVRTGGNQSSNPDDSTTGRSSSSSSSSSTGSNGSNANGLAAPLDKPSTCQGMCAQGQYHGDIKCALGLTCVLILEGGPVATDSSSSNSSSSGGVSSSSSRSSSSIQDSTADSTNSEFLAATGAIMPYEGICAPSHWLEPNCSASLLTSPASMTSLGAGLSTVPVPGRAGSVCSFGGNAVPLLCEAGYSCIVPAERRTMDHPVVQGVCVSVDVCDPYLEERIEDEAGMAAPIMSSAWSVVSAASPPWRWLIAAATMVVVQLLM